MTLSPPSSEYPVKTARAAPLDAPTLAHLQTWVDRREVQEDTLTATPLRALTVTLERTPAPLQDATAVPPLWHWLYFLPHTAQSEIGADGHPKRGGFLPPVPLPRRMWAGSQLQWVNGNTLKARQTVQRHSRIQSVTHKTGQSGDLVFVQVAHELHNAHGLALTETHDIVYRNHPTPSQATPQPKAAPVQAPWQRTLLPEPVLLFRYSALTFNGHRIHYDRSYAMQAEGYPGLVVHGPLIATLLLDLLHRQQPQAQLKSFQFKAVRPCFDGNALHLNGSPSTDGKHIQLWASDHEGWLAMQASAELY